MATRNRFASTARSTSFRSRTRTRAKARPAIEHLESRLVLDGTMKVGAGTIFTVLPPPPEGRSNGYLTPSNQPILLSNIVGNTGLTSTPPDIAPGSPAASLPVPSNQTWTGMITRDPNEPIYLPNSAAYILVDPKTGNAISATVPNVYGQPMLFAQYYQAHPNLTPPPADAPFYGRSIVAVDVGGVTKYKYQTNDKTGAVEGPARILPYQPNAGDPISFGDMSFNIKDMANNTFSTDAANNFGTANTPFTTTPNTLFSLTSQAKYLDYRPGSGPNATAVTIQQQNAAGKYVTVPANTTDGLIPYFNYNDYTVPKNSATNAFTVPNSADLGVSVMDLGVSDATKPFQNPTGIDGNSLELWNYSDDAATFNMGSSAIGNLQVTMSQASPFTQFSYVRGTDSNQLFLMLRNNDITGFNGKLLSSTATYDARDNAIIVTGYSPPASGDTFMNVVQDPNVLVKVFYAIYLPTGVDGSKFVSTADGTKYGNDNPNLLTNPLFGANANDIFLPIPAGFGTQAKPFNFVITALPNLDGLPNGPQVAQSTIALFRQYAFNYITGSTNTPLFTAATSQAGMSFSVTTTNVDTASNPNSGALVTIYPLQYDNLKITTDGPQYVLNKNLGGKPYLTLSSIWGQLRLMVAPAKTTATNGVATWSASYTLPYTGSLSILPQGAFVGDANGGDNALVDLEQFTAEVKLINDQLYDLDPNTQLTNNGQGDSYVWGQELQKLASLIPIAAQLGLASQQYQLIAEVESEMSQWFNANTVLNTTNSSQVLGYDPHLGVPQFLYYDSTWNALTGYNAGHGSDTKLNDMMYQWGYWIQAASIIGAYDPTFVSSTGYGPVINMIIQNVDNWNRNDTRFPYMRTFDLFAGHAWASGVTSVGDGQNEEAISEAINFDSGMIAWANLLIANNQASVGTPMLNTAVAMQTLETAAYREYYLNVNNDTFPPATIVSYGGKSYGAGGYITVQSYKAAKGDPKLWKNEIYASNQYTINRGTQLFFLGNDITKTNNAEAHYAITILPFSPSSLYLGSNPTLAAAQYKNYIDQQNSVYTTAAQKQTMPIAFFASLEDYQALTNPAGALQRWNGIGNYRLNLPANSSAKTLETDNYTKYTFQATIDTQAATYYYLQFFNKYGLVVGNVTATGATQTAVLGKAPAGNQKTWNRTYIIENIGSNPIASVKFSDGTTVTNVPARSVYAYTVMRDQADGKGKVVGTYSNTYKIGLATNNGGPPTGGGTNLFLGYSQPAAPQTKVVEPLTLKPQTNPGLVAITYYKPTPQDAQFAYPNATPVIAKTSAEYPPGQSLPQTNIVTFQATGVNGTFDPAKKLDTKFQLYFKAPLGFTQTSLQIGVQVRYSGTSTGLTYVETYTFYTIQGIGNLVVVTNNSKETIPGRGIGNGVTLATQTTGNGTIDPGLNWAVYPPNASNKYLLKPTDGPASGRTVQLSPSAFTLKNGTVTVTVFIARFNNDNPKFQFADPELQFIAGLPGYAGLRSSVTIPFTNVTIGAPATHAATAPSGPTEFVTGGSPPPTPPVVAALVPSGSIPSTLTADVTAGGKPISSGTVTFFDNGTNLGSAAVANGIASLTLSRPLPAGAPNITVIYSAPGTTLPTTPTTTRPAQGSGSLLTTDLEWKW
jgi:hypothetical protein